MHKSFETPEATEVKSVYNKMSTRSLLKAINEDSELNQQIKSSGVSAEYKPITAPTNAAYRLLRVTFSTKGNKAEKRSRQKERKNVNFNSREQEEESDLETLQRSCLTSTSKFSQPEHTRSLSKKLSKDG